MDVSSISDMKLHVSFAQGLVAQKTATRDAQKASSGPQVDALKMWDDLVTAVSNNRTIQMEFDKEIGRVVIQVVDGNSQQVVAQIPSEELVSLMRRMGRYLRLTLEGRV
jgi:uncharacterized FlaG/YvyC family protein